MLNKTVAAMLLAPLAVVTLASAAWADNRPIPGVDIIVQKDPGDGKLVRVQTNREGRFVVEGLTAGTYTVRIPAPVAARAIISTTRSNIKKPTSAMARGIEVVTIEAEMGQGPAEAVFMIGAARGSLSRGGAARETCASFRAPRRSRSTPRNWVSTT